MKKSGLQSAMDGYQVPAAVKRAVCFVPMHACDRLIINNGDDHSGMEVRDYFALLFSTDKFVGHNSLCVVRAAVVGEYRLAVAVLMMHVTLPVAAGSVIMLCTAVLHNRVTGHGGYCFVSTAMETCMMNKGKAETARQHERNQKK
jgi:hypothetical protein